MKPRLSAVLTALILTAVCSQFAVAQNPTPPAPGAARPSLPGSILGVVKADSAGPALVGAAVTIRSARVGSISQFATAGGS